MSILRFQGNDLGLVTAGVGGIYLFNFVSKGPKIDTTLKPGITPQEAIILSLDTPRINIPYYGVHEVLLDNTTIWLNRAAGKFDSGRYAGRGDFVVDCEILQPNLREDFIERVLRSRVRLQPQ